MHKNVSSFKEILVSKQNIKYILISEISFIAQLFVVYENIDSS